MGITVNLTGGNKFAAVLDKLAKQAEVSLKVGVLEGATDPAGELIAPRAFYNEFGTVDVESRPAFRSTIDEKAGEWAQGLEDSVRGHMDEPSILARAFNQLGQVMAEDIQDKIGSGVGPALAETTVKAKTRKGLAAPGLQLVEDADYQNSINFEVETK